MRGLVAERRERLTAEQFLAHEIIMNEYKRFDGVNWKLDNGNLIKNGN